MVFYYGSQNRLKGAARMNQLEEPVGWRYRFGRHQHIGGN